MIHNTLKTVIALAVFALVADGAIAADAKKGAAKPAAAAKATKGKTIEVGTGDPKNKKDTEASLFNVTEIPMKVGEEVTIKFTNRSKTPGMMHNLVVTNPGKDKDVANAGIAAGPDKGWVPDASDVLFKTKLLDAGKSETITVKFDKAGDYPFICTFPGHYPMMKGTIKVSK